MMSSIKDKATKTEVLACKALHREGSCFCLRLRLHNKKLPGKFDIVLSKYKTVILVNGCFWHAHDYHQS